MATNNFLPFCPTDTGTNLLSQADYAAATDRGIGNQPGVASSKLVNKAIRQSAFMTSQLAQFLGDVSGSNILDDAVSARLLAQINAVLAPLPPIWTKLTTGSGNHNLTYYFMIASGSATIGATYTHNGVTYTVKKTVASGVILIASGNAAPLGQGTLTKATGTGDATITFYAFRAPKLILIEGCGAGGGGAGSGSAAGGTGGNGGNTTFGTTLCVGNGGAGAQHTGSGGTGGTASLGTGPYGDTQQGGYGQGYSFNGNTANFNFLAGGMGGFNRFAGPGCSKEGNAAGQNALANTGAGGQGGGSGSAASDFAGAGGGAGGYFKAYIDYLNVAYASTFAYAIGAKGSGGAAGTNGFAGGDGSDGVLELLETF